MTQNKNKTKQLPNIWYSYVRHVSILYRDIYVEKALYNYL